MVIGAKGAARVSTTGHSTREEVIDLTTNGDPSIAFIGPLIKDRLSGD